MAKLAFIDTILPAQQNIYHDSEFCDNLAVYSDRRTQAEGEIARNWLANVSAATVNMSETSLTPLSIKGLKKSFGSNTVLDGVEMNVEAGTIHGLVGLNGAGKTTAMSCMLGLQPYQQGMIQIFGKNPQHLYQTRGKVAAVFDEPCLHPNFSVEDVLQLAQLSVGSKDRSERLKQMRLLGIERYRSYKVKNLSLGNRRRTAIAQALVSKPAFIILDEPFNGLDAGGVDDVLALIKQLNQREGISFLLASHQLSYLESTCTHMSILHQGKVAKTGAIKQLLVDERSRVMLQVDKPSAAKEALNSMSGVSVLDDDGESGAVVCELLDTTSAQLNRSLIEKGYAISELRLYKPSLNALFRSVTGAHP